jgi:hypothetical protein
MRIDQRPFEMIQFWIVFTQDAIGVGIVTPGNPGQGRVSRAGVTLSADER